MKCVYCGQNEAQVKIPNPNGELLGEKDTWEWDVCIPCEKTINLQQKLSALHMDFWRKDKNYGMVGKYNDLIRKTEEEIDHISAEDGQEAVTFVITKKEKA